MKSAIKHIGIITLVVVIGFGTACSSDGDDPYINPDPVGTIFVPPSIPSQVGGVYVPPAGASNAGKLVIENPNVYQITGSDSNGAISGSTYADLTVKAIIYFSGESEELGTGSISGGKMNLVISVPADANLVTVKDFFDFFPDHFFKSGVDVKIQVPFIQDGSDPSGDYFTLASGNSVFEKDLYWGYKNGEAYAYVYSKGDVNISGVANVWGETLVVGLKFVAGWNCVCFIENSSTDTFTIISKSPPNGAKWVPAKIPL